MNGIAKSLLAWGVIALLQIGLAFLFAPHRSWALDVYTAVGLAALVVGIGVSVWLCRELTAPLRALVVVGAVVVIAAAWCVGLVGADIPILARLF